MIEQKILKDSQVELFFDKNDYSSAADYLLKSQLNSWPLLKDNYIALENVQTKSFWYDGFKLKLQFNPQRIKSTTALVDENSIKERKCFLCIDNLPEEQKSILLLDSYFLLCNPYPIFPQHFTVSSVNHKPQQISDSFNELLEITKLLSPQYTLVYNGPACGASAPDHMHFQVGTKYFIPVENDIQQLKNNFGNIIQEDELISTSFIDDGLRRIIFIESTYKKNIEQTFKVIYNIYKRLTGTEHEPMMNIVSSYDSEFGWSVIIFLRSKHRPECYFKTDSEKILISPAAIDLGGVVVTPLEQDFSRVNEKLLCQIFNEVSLDQKTFSLLEEKIKK